MAMKERLIQLTLRARDFLSRDVAPATAAVASLAEEGKRLKAALTEAGQARALARTLRDNEAAAAGLERAWRDADATLSDLTREFGENAQATAGQRIALREARQAVDQAERAFKRNQSAIRNVTSELKQLGVDTRSIVDEEQRLTRELADHKQALEQNREAIKRKREEEKKAADAAEQHTSRITAAREAMASGARQALAFAAAYVSLDAALGLVGRALGALRRGAVDMLSVGDQFEGLQARMNSLMGSVAAGEQATAWIKAFAKDTPLQLDEVTEAFALMRSYGLDPMDGSLQALVDKNEQLGGGMERLTGLASALGQAWTKQKLQTEEILQLVERGVPVWELLSKVTGKNTEQLQKLASEGRIGRDVIRKLIKEIGASAEGAAAENMGRLSGLMSNLADTATDFYNRIAQAGALDYVKGRFQELLTTIAQMEGDGRLDRLAKAFSDAFVQGAQWVEAFARRLAGVDFTQLADKTSGWLGDFGAKLDDAAMRVQLFVAPFRTLFNGLTAGLSLFAAGALSTVDRVIGLFEKLGRAIPDAMGGEKLRATLAETRAGLQGVTEGLLDQIEQDGRDIAAAWDTTNASITESTRQAAAEQVAAHKSAVEQQRVLDQAYADELAANQKRAKDAAVQAAIEGKAAIGSMAEALKLIDTASTQEQLEGLRVALLRAYQSGSMGVEQYQQATGLLNTKLKQIKASATDAADGISDLDEKLGDLASVQRAIGDAKTDVDIRNIKKALRELYEEGAISAGRYNEELQKVTAKQKELKDEIHKTTKAATDAAEPMARSVEMYNAALEDSILTNEELRRISGQRMEEERRASGEAMERQRKGIDTTKKDMSAMSDFFGGVLTQARQPLAQMSAAALEAYDRLSGIKSVDMSIDTSSLEATRESLRRVSEAMAATQAAASAASSGPFSRWQAEALLRSQQIQASYLGQKAKLQSLMEGYSDGSMTVEQFVRRAKSAQRTLGLLDKSDLSSLRSAIQSAEQQMESLGDSTRSTLEGLQMELLQLKGTQDQIERARFQSRRREIQAQMEDARKSGNSQSVSNLQQSLGVLDQIERESANKRRREAQQQTEAAPAATPAAPAKVIRLETSRGQSVEVGLPSEADETRLLGILESAGLRSL